MGNLLSEFKESLKRTGISKKDRLLLAVSGGMDSVILTKLCEMSEMNFAMAHANFQLRAEESGRDEIFVKELAGKYKKNCFITKFNTTEYASIHKCSIQVAARELRYKWFKTFIGNNENDYRFLLTAHHLDDNIETMLMNFFRGTGISGLTGMPAKNDFIVRPLLAFSKSKLNEFANTEGLIWVEDSSNADDHYTRNYLRNQLMPSVSKVYPGLLFNLAENLQRFSDAELLYQQAVRQHKKKLMVLKGSEVHLPVLLLKKAVPLKTILYEILKEFHFSPSQTDEVIGLIDSSSGKYISGTTHRVIKNRRWLIIAPFSDLSIAHVSIEKSDDLIIYPEGEIQIREIEMSEKERTALPGTEFLDADKIQFPLLLRKWKTGDYFYPLGMKKKKKLARFFIDQKISKTAKEKIWVLVMDSQIIWVVGHRIDNRFCRETSTKKILMLRNQSISS